MFACKLASIRPGGGWAQATRSQVRATFWVPHEPPACASCLSGAVAGVVTPGVETGWGEEEEAWWERSHPVPCWAGPLLCVQAQAPGGPTKAQGASQQLPAALWGLGSTCDGLSPAALQRQSTKPCPWGPIPGVTPPGTCLEVPAAQVRPSHCSGLLCHLLSGPACPPTAQYQVPSVHSAGMRAPKWRGSVLAEAGALSGGMTPPSSGRGWELAAWVLSGSTDAQLPDCWGDGRLSGVRGLLLPS